jgi:hypothetical protein
MKKWLQPRDNQRVAPPRHAPFRYVRILIRPSLCPEILLRKKASSTSISFGDSYRTPARRFQNLSGSVTLQSFFLFVFCFCFVPACAKSFRFFGVHTCNHTCTCIPPPVSYMYSTLQITQSLRLQDSRMTFKSSTQLSQLFRGLSSAVFARVAACARRKTRKERDSQNHREPQGLHHLA